MDLLVPEHTTLTLNAGQPTSETAPAATRQRVDRLSDLVALGLTTAADLDTMLAAARDATADALSVTGRPVAFVPGTARPDLGRFTGYINRLPDQNTAEARLVWNTLRHIEPRRLQATTARDTLQVARWIGQFLFNDITVQAGGALHIQASTQLLRARHIVLQAGARLVVQGASLAVRAQSIQGL